MMGKLSSGWQNFFRFLFPVILLLYPLRHIRVGAEWWDTGYNYANFVYMDRMDPMWLFSTFLGNALGHFFTLLPLGDRMLGLNLYTGLVVSLLALGGYFFFVKKVGLPRPLVFWGEVLAVSFCWCPAALLYNYLTYVLFGAGVVCLYCALEQPGPGSRKYFVLAGICLGLNVYVRFPNLAQMALILAVWAMALIRREKPGRAAAWTGWCLLGYLGGLALGFGGIALRFGPGEYAAGIRRLLSMPQEASEYTVVSMAVSQIRNYWQNLIWLAYFAGFAAVGLAVYHLLPRSWKWIKNLGCLGAVCCFFYYMILQNMYNMKYSTKASVFQWAAFLLTASLAGGLTVIFSRRFAPREKLLAGLGILVILITPLGSNNHLYASINNLFFVLPGTLWLLVRFLRFLPDEVRMWKRKGLGWEQVHWKKPLSLYPLKALLAAMLAMITFQGVAFGFGYVFSETDGGENLHTPVENNRVLAGILTSPDRAQLLTDLTAYVQEENLTGRQVILYGQIPALSYYLEMPFAITPWPDLASYNYSVMESDLSAIAARAREKGEELPVVILERKQYAFLTGGERALEELGASQKERERIPGDKKLALLSRFMEEHGYRLTSESSKFCLFQAGMR